MADDGSGPPDLVLPFVTFSGFFVSILEASVNSAPYNRIMTLTPLVVVFYTVAVFLSVSLTGLMVAGRISNTGDEYAALFTLLTATAWPAARQLTRCVTTWADDELHRASGVGRATWASFVAANENTMVAAAAAADDDERRPATLPTAPLPVSAACAVLAEQREWLSEPPSHPDLRDPPPPGAGRGRIGARRRDHPWHVHPWYDRLVGDPAGFVSPWALFFRWSTGDVPALWRASVARTKGGGRGAIAAGDNTDVDRGGGGVAARGGGHLACVGRLVAEGLFLLFASLPLALIFCLRRAAAGRVRRSFAAIGGVPDGALPGCARYSDPIADDPAASVAAVGPEYWALASGVDEAGAGWLLVRIVAAAAGAREAPSEAEAYAAVAAVVGPDAWRAGRGHGGDRGRREGTEGGGSALVDTPPVAAATAKAAAMDTEAGVTPGEPYTPSCRELLLTFAFAAHWAASHGLFSAVGTSASPPPPPPPSLSPPPPPSASPALAAAAVAAPPNGGGTAWPATWAGTTK